MGLSLFQGYFLLFLLWMTLFGVSALDALDRLVVVRDLRVFGFLAHPILEETDSFKLWVHHNW